MVHGTKCALGDILTIDGPIGISLQLQLGEPDDTLVEPIPNRLGRTRFASLKPLQPSRDRPSIRRHGKQSRAA
jgi:hypothetical protein